MIVKWLRECKLDDSFTSFPSIRDLSQELNDRLADMQERSHGGFSWYRVVRQNPPRFNGWWPFPDNYGDSWIYCLMFHGPRDLMLFKLLWTHDELKWRDDPHLLSYPLPPKPIS